MYTCTGLVVCDPETLTKNAARHLTTFAQFIPSLIPGCLALISPFDSVEQGISLPLDFFLRCSDEYSLVTIFIYIAKLLFISDCMPPQRLQLFRSTSFKFSTCRPSADVLLFYLLIRRMSYWMTVLPITWGGGRLKISLR